MPWETERLTPVELQRLFDGWAWRRSRDMDVLATAVTWIRSMLDNKADTATVLESFPRYVEDDK